MRPNQIEAWTLSVVDRVRSSQPIEDDRVELKATWIGPDKAARRLAAHANAARGEPILWIIGVDEDQSEVLGVEREEVADWWSGIEKRFDVLTPSVSVVNVPVEDKTVVSLYMETDRAPFVVTNPGGSPVSREVPWREGTAVRSAKREDLIRLLTPLQSLPEIEVLNGTLRVVVDPEDKELPLGWRAELKVYGVPTMDEPVVFPFHRCRGSIAFPDIGLEVDLPEIAMWASRHSLNIASTSLEQMVMRGPGRFTLRGSGSSKELPSPPEGDAHVDFHLQPVHAEAPLAVSAVFHRLPEGAVYKAWAGWATR